jgi:type IV secretory pathway VirB3-like protein
MLVVFQPVLFSAWCTLCLASAVISILMIGPAMDEMLASLQFMKRVRDTGHSVWKAFWGVNSEIQKVK